MPFKNDFFLIFMDFGRENGAKLAPKSCQKSMLTSNGRFSRKPTKTSRNSTFFINFETQVGSQNALKIDPKIYSKIKCSLASIFLDFGRFLADFDAFCHTLEPVLYMGLAIFRYLKNNILFVFDDFMVLQNRYIHGVLTF